MSSTISQIFGRKLKRARKDCGYQTARAFADLIAVEENTLTRWERGETEPSFAMLLHICQILQTGPNELLLGPRTSQRSQYLYVAEHIDASGMTDQELAEKLGYSRVTVWRWRAEQRSLTIDRQVALAEALGIEPEELWHPPQQRNLPA